MEIKNFDIQLKATTRKIVIHHTHNIDEKQFLIMLHDNDILFFDDCLYSQYFFIKKYMSLFIQRNIICILGFSTKIYRTTQKPLLDIDSAVLHDKIHLNHSTALGGFMSINEINELLTYSNIFLAGHGANHLKLITLTDNKVMQSKLFMFDVNEMIRDFKSFNMKTEIFVFPYAYDDFPCAQSIVHHNNFKYIFAGKNTQRVEIEHVIQNI